MTQEQELLSFIVRNNISLTYNGNDSGARLVTYRFKPVFPFKINTLKSLAPNLALYLGIDGIEAIIEAGEIKIIVPIKDAAVLSYNDYLFNLLNQSKEDKQDGILLPLGITPQGVPASIPITQCPHLLIAGATGSGKSNYLSMCLATWHMLYNPCDLRIDIIDLKNVDLVFFRNYSLVSNYITDLPSFTSRLVQLENEIKRRLMLFSGHVRNINEYNKANPSNKIPVQIVLIDEYGSLMVDYKDKKEKYKDEGIDDPFIKMLLLTQLSRAAGVHFILCTQRCSVKIVTGDIKTNFPTRMAFKVASGMDSRIILDENGAENLLSQGDMLVKSNASDILQRYHVPYVSLRDIEALQELKTYQPDKFSL